MSLESSIVEDTSMGIVVPYWKLSHESANELLRNALSSIRSQVIKPQKMEVIIVQDRDPEDLSDIISYFQDMDVSSFCQSTEKCGLSNARNKGVAICKCDYILFLDSDDELTPNCLEAVLQWIKNDPKWDVCFSNFTKYDERMNRVERLINSSFYFDLFKKLGNSHYNPIFHSIFIGHCIIVRRDSFQSIGGFDETLKCGEITDIMLKMFYHRFKFSHIRNYLYRYRNNPRGLSKRPDINYARSNSILKYYGKVFDERLTRVEPLGRIKPYQHMHFNLYAKDNRLIKLPYLDYENLSIRSIN